MLAIELKNVTKDYGSGDAKVSALKQVNFAANRGEVVLIEGPSGAGKSTMLTIAGLLQRPTSGEVWINGQDYSKVSNRKADQVRLNKIGFVLQAYNLVPYLKVKEQFELVDKIKKSDNMSQKSLKKLIIQLAIDNLMNKYPNELSGGQKQRVALARALYAEPEIVLADEPTASLDSENVEQVGRLFKDLAQNNQKAIILVTHDERLEQFANHIYKMMDGILTKIK
ncbi:MAG: ABC transporter ATP-binding protein [Lactobacillus sp.]|nr:ABC transporter ATP-binding protein [Lactobacillus sp.]